MNTKLSVCKVVTGAFLIPWWNRKVFVRSLLIPIILMMIFSVVGHYVWKLLPALSQWFFSMINLVIFVLFAVICHRLVLLGNESVDPNFKLRWSRRETKFLLWAIGGGLFLLAILLIVVTIVFNALSLFIGIKPNKMTLGGMEFLAAAPAFYVFARYCVIYPAIAVEKKVRLQWAWNVSRGNGWRIVLVVGALPWLFTQCVNLLTRESATVFEVVAITLLGCVLAIVEVAALSLTYRELSREEEV